MLLSVEQALSSSTMEAMGRPFDLRLLGRRLIFGPGTVEDVGSVARELGATHVMVISDRGVAQAGLLERLLTVLRKAGLVTSEFTEIVGEPSWRVVQEAAAHIEAQACDFVIGFGGGSAMDVAKGASVLATVGDTVEEYWTGDRWTTALPKILIPTTAGTGSELSTSAVFTDVDGYKKAMRGEQLGARVAVVDPLLTLTLPPKPTADSGMDALIHAIEAYTSRRSHPFGDIFAERAIALISVSLREVYHRGDDLAARYRMSLASTMAGVAAAMNGVGAVHALTYPLSTTAQVTHGLANSLLLPHVVAYNYPASPQRYGWIVRLLEASTEPLSTEEGAQRLIAALERLRLDLGMPSRLRDVGIRQDQFEGFVDFVFRYFQRNLEANARAMSRDAALAIYQAAW